MSYRTVPVTLAEVRQNDVLVVTPSKTAAGSTARYVMSARAIYRLGNGFFVIRGDRRTLTAPFKLGYQDREVTTGHVTIGGTVERITPS